MSGHSHWAGIKFKKAITDKRKGKVFTKLAHLITIAARENSEIKLRLAIEKAKQANLPSDNIERAIKRGKGELDGVKLVDIVYEGFGPEKIAILISVTTDNKNRTSSEIRNALENHGGKMSGAGSIAWMFEQLGIIRVETGDKSTEEIELLAIDAGADDVKEEENEIIIYTKPENLEHVKKILEDSGLKIISYEISQVPKNSVKINDLETAKKVLKLMDALDEIDEVIFISSNFEMPDDLMKEIEGSS